MTNHELSPIIDKILKGEGVTLIELAKEVDLGRSHLSSFLNDPAEKLVTPRMLRKISAVYPKYFPKSNKSNTLLQAEQLPIGNFKPTVGDYVKKIEEHNLFLQNLIRDGIIALKTNSDATLEDLEALERQNRSQLSVVMNALDHLLKQKEGTLATEAGTLELRAAGVKKKKGNPVG